MFQPDPILNPTVFIDESGDFGFSDRSSKHIVFVSVATDQPNAVARIAKKTRARFKRKRPVELHASHDSWEVREYTLERLALPETRLEIRALVVDKFRLAPRLQRDSNMLWNHCVGLLTVDYLAQHDHATLVIDHRTQHTRSVFQFQPFLDYLLRFDADSDAKVEIEYMDSRFSNGVQLADCVSNAIYRKHEHGEDQGWKLIRGKIVSETVFDIKKR
ncbi:MAG: DUF3800 domain-containing protein [Candidatus Poribacteria bacterium]|nr:DUF3800 domain-containing protein [Candidatus Poribacteria bacterium]